MSDQKHLDAGLAAPSRQQEGSVTPSDMSFVDEKEQHHHNDEEKEDESGELERVESSVYPSGWKMLSIMLGVALAMFLVALDMTIVATAIPRITDEFKSLDDVGWYGSAFFLTVAAFQATWGKGFKYFPLKTTFLTAVGVFEIGSLICAVAKNSTTLIVGRAIAGAGGAGIASGAYTIIAFSAKPSQVAAFTGILGAVYALASVVGPLLGGVFTDNLSWRWCFYINLPIGGASAFIILFFFQTPKAAKPVEATLKEKLLQMDLPGTFILMASFTCLILTLQWGGVTKSWGSSQVIGLLVGFVLILVLFIVTQIWQGDRALIVPRLMKQKTIALLSVWQVFNSGMFLLLMYYLPIYFQVVSGVSASKSGIRNLPLILGVSLFSIVSGVGITLTGYYLPFTFVGAVCGTIGSGLLYTLGVHSPSSQWIGYQALAGIGIGLGVQVPIIVSQAVSLPQDISSITAIMIFYQTISGAVFVSVGQSVFANKLIHTVPQLVPGVDPKLVVATGATELRKVFDPSQLPGVIASYMAGLKDAYALSIALAGLAVVVSAIAIVIDRRRLGEHEKKQMGGAA
ncbi:hypothetical protein FKW77_002901 [Venturia effusa]|uniref:Major facilitator superfamily (MFS) profile domain-containing protein n=1 Tax=Venturia effusa TaxID=50376 RepID=A0A517LAK8_9PEZI|nr:hypothetical protein FKW77_002901 [Venturia effusa]